MSRKSRTAPKPVLLARSVSTVITYRTAAGAVFEPGEYHPAVCNEGESLYNLTHSRSGELVCFCQAEVYDPKSTTRSHAEQQAAAAELHRRRALPGNN